MKKIAFNGRPFIAYEMRGFPRHTQELILNIHKLRPDLKIVIYSNTKVAQEYKDQLNFCEFRESQTPKILWEIFILPFLLYRDRVDLFHSTINWFPPFVKLGSWQEVVTIHDDITHQHYLEASSNPKYWWSLFQYYLVLIKLHFVKKVITVSAISKENICRTLFLERENVKVIYNGYRAIEPQLSPTLRENFLYVGGFDRRKNIPFLLNEFLSYSNYYKTNDKLILAGNCSKLSLEEKKIIDSNDCFILKDSPSDQELTQLYRNAKAVILPSLDEGFGLQIIEAFAQGTPVLASHIPAYYEIGKKLAVYFSPFQSSSLCKILGNFDLIQINSADLQEYSKNFSWEVMAAQTLDYYSI